MRQNLKNGIRRLKILGTQKNSLIIIMFFVFINTNAQKIKYEFLSTYSNEFFTKKIINDSVYVEKDIFRRLSTNIKFLKDFKTHTIYIVDRSGKSVFFDGKSKDILLNYRNEKVCLKWEQSLLRTKEGYVIFKMFFEFVDVFITHQPIYYFTFENGIIAIEGSDFTLKRSDFTYLELNDGFVIN